MSNEKQKYSPDSSNEVLRDPYLSDKLAAATELLGGEPSVSIDVLNKLSPDDVIEMDCGSVIYTLAPTTLDVEVADDIGKRIFMSIKSSGEHNSDRASGCNNPRLEVGFPFLIDGTAALPSGTMLKVGKLVRNGYLSVRIPWVVEEAGREIALTHGYTISGKGILILNGEPLFRPEAFTSETMLGMKITKPDGTQTVLF